jgi:hypothetical protein
MSDAHPVTPPPVASIATSAPSTCEGRKWHPGTILLCTFLL